MVRSGWQSKLKGEEFAPYEVRKHELSIQNECVLWGSRVIVPNPGQNVMKQLHQYHPGVSRVKALARSYVWWPKLDKEVEDTLKGCATCQEHHNIPASAPLHTRDWPDKPYPCGLCRTVYGKNVFCACQCTFKMDGPVSNELCHFSHHN